MLTHEAIKLIQKTAVEAEGAGVLETPAEPDHIYLLDTKDGIQERVAAVHPHHFNIADLASFKEIIKEAESTGRIFVNNECLLLLYADTRRDKASLDLQRTAQWLSLENINVPVPPDGYSFHTTVFDQKGLIRFLRIVMRGCLDDEGDVLTALAHLKFTNDAAAEATVSDKRESMGRSITNELHGADSLPDTVFLNVNIFATPGVKERARIACSLEVNLLDRNLRFKPYPDELDKAVADAVGNIIKDVRAGTKLPIYRGGE